MCGYEAVWVEEDGSTESQEKARRVERFCATRPEPSSNRDIAVGDEVTTSSATHCLSSDPALALWMKIRRFSAVKLDLQQESRKACRTQNAQPMFQFFTLHGIDTAIIYE